jgi:hypothetical protein
VRLSDGTVIPGDEIKAFIRSRVDRRGPHRDVRKGSCGGALVAGPTKSWYVLSARACGVVDRDGDIRDDDCRRKPSGSGTVST